MRDCAQKHSAYSGEISAIVVVPIRLPTEVTELLICDGHPEFPSSFSAGCFTSYSLSATKHAHLSRPSTRSCSFSSAPSGRLRSELKLIPLFKSDLQTFLFIAGLSEVQQGPPLHLQNQEIANRWHFASEGKYMP